MSDEDPHVDVRPAGVAAGRPDNTNAIVGRDGNLFTQTTGRMVTREGVVAEDADWDIRDHDLVADGEYVADPESIGGTSILVIVAESASDNEFSIVFDVIGQDGDKLVTVEPPHLQNRTSVNGKSSVYSDRMNARIVDESGAESNVVNGSINIHSGGSESVQLLNSSGEIVDPVFEGNVEELNVEMSEEFEELRSEFSNTSGSGSVAAADNDSGLSVDLDTGGRASVNFAYDVGSAVTVTVEVSSGRATWYEFEQVELEAGSGVEQFPWMGHRHVRVSTDEAGVDLSFELSASR